MERESRYAVDGLADAVSIRADWAGRGFQPIVKRMVDLCLGGIATLLLLPALAVVAILIKLDSPGPAFFKQERIGRFGKEFTMLKFRTMYVNADPEAHLRAIELAVRCARSELPHGQDVFKPTDDPRITRIGRTLRTWNLDELPQLVNVLRGEMSLVGPRPSLSYELPMYKDWYFSRFAVRPGLTGLWQVKRRTAEDFDGMMQMDIDYVESVSIWLDLKIIAMTIPAIVRDRGVF